MDEWYCAATECATEPDAQGGAGCAAWGLQLVVVNTSYASARGTAATEWSLEFRNTGLAPSPPLCAVQTLDALLPVAPAGNLTVEFRSACAIISPVRPGDAVVPVSHTRSPHNAFSSTEQPGA